MADLYVVKHSPGRGLGVFAKKAIRPGTVIMRDAMRMKLSRGSLDVTEEQVDDALSAMNHRNQEGFMELHEGKLPYTSRAMRIYKSNAFGDGENSWIFLKFSRLNHSCDPNAELTEIEDPSEAKVVALKHIANGEEVFISYLGPLDDGPKCQRSQLLKQTYGFDCGCTTCNLTGDQAELSDAKRQLINALSHRQQGFETGELRLLNNVNGLVTSKQSKTLGRSKQSLQVPLTSSEKVVTNFLLARLLEAESQVNYSLPQAYVTAAASLMGQMQAMKPLIILPSAEFVNEWLTAAVKTMKRIRGSESNDLKELQQACAIMEKCSYMEFAKATRRETVKGRVFATILGQSWRCLTQAECKAYVRKK